MKSLVYGQVITRDENTPESASISPSNRINYWPIAVALLAVACLLLPMARVVRYYLKCVLTIPFLLSSKYRDELCKKIKYCTYYCFDDMIIMRAFDT